jgi:hypothetical protein
MPNVCVEAPTAVFNATTTHLAHRVAARFVLTRSATIVMRDVPANLMTVYFIKHSLDKYRGVPGRYGFNVHSASLQRRGTTWSPSRYSGQVYADGQGDEQPSFNVDPYVFSDVLPWHLSYCLIDKRDKKRTLRGTRQVLSEAATSLTLGALSTAGIRFRKELA